jgi:Uma2 family endonuclease
MKKEYPKPRLWNYEEYYQMYEAGFFQDQRIELIDGEVFQHAPQSSDHAVGVGLTVRAFWPLTEQNYWVRSLMPVRLALACETEPDLSIVKGEPHEHMGKGHPRSSLLVIEVADSS